MKKYLETHVSVGLLGGLPRRVGLRRGRRVGAAALGRASGPRGRGRGGRHGPRPAALSARPRRRAQRRHRTLLLDHHHVVVVHAFSFETCRIMLYKGLRLTVSAVRSIFKAIRWPFLPHLSPGGTRKEIATF